MLKKKQSKSSNFYILG